MGIATSASGPLAKVNLPEGLEEKVDIFLCQLQRFLPRLLPYGLWKPDFAPLRQRPVGGLMVPPPILWPGDESSRAVHVCRYVTTGRTLGYTCSSDVALAPFDRPLAAT